MNIYGSGWNKWTYNVIKGHDIAVQIVGRDCLILDDLHYGLDRFEPYAFH
jgi:hypothetical protein